MPDETKQSTYHVTWPPPPSPPRLRFKLLRCTRRMRLLRRLLLSLRLPPLRPNPTLTSNSPFISSSSFWSRTRACSPKRMSSSSSSAAVVAEGSAARRFWIAASSREAAFASYTPFLLSLAAGVLRLDSFRHYVAQDAHFLQAFARAYEMAEECADDDDDKATIAALRKAVLRELNLHASVLQEWGVDPTKEIPLSPATTKYTDFLLATAAGKVDGGKGSHGGKSRSVFFLQLVSLLLPLSITSSRFYTSRSHHSSSTT